MWQLAIKLAGFNSVIWILLVFKNLYFFSFLRNFLLDGNPNLSRDLSIGNFCGILILDVSSPILVGPSIYIISERIDIWNNFDLNFSRSSLFNLICFLLVWSGSGGSKIKFQFGGLIVLRITKFWFIIVIFVNHLGSISWISVTWRRSWKIVPQFILIIIT